MTLKDTALRIRENALSILNKCNCGGKPRVFSDRGCNSLVTNTPLEGPDLATYSQELELLNGNIATWNSPDISTNWWNPFRLMPEAVFKVRNLSGDVAAIGVLLHYSISQFGIGTRKQLKLTKRVNISPAAEVELRFPLDPSTFAGDPRIGVHLEIEHPFDRNVINNYGSQVHDQGYTSQSGREFTIQVPILNDSNSSREIKLSILSTDMECSVIPATHLFAPQEQVMASLNIRVPSFLVGTPEANVIREVTMVGRLSTNDLVGGV